MASHSRLTIIDLAEMNWCFCMGMKYTVSESARQFFAAHPPTSRLAHLQQTDTDQQTANSQRKDASDRDKD